MNAPYVTYRDMCRSWRDIMVRNVIFGNAVLPEGLAPPSYCGKRDLSRERIPTAHQTYAPAGSRQYIRYKCCLDWGINDAWAGVCFQQIALLVETNRAICCCHTVVWLLLGGGV